MSEHLSRFHLMRVLGGELDVDARAAADRHIEGCEVCRSTFDALKATQAEGRQMAPMLVVQKTPAGPVWWRAALGGGFAVAACAMAVLVFVLPSEGVRVKGDVQLEMFCRPPAAKTATRCRSGDRVRPGTGVMFHVQIPDARHLMLLGQDETGPVVSYFPADGEHAVRVETNAKDFMSASIVVDDTPGRERFVLLASKRPFSKEEVVGAVSNPAAVAPEIRVIRVVLEKDLSQNVGDERGSGR